LFTKKKILYIHHGLGIGGAPLSMLFLIRNLDRAVYEPVILCLYNGEAAELFRKEHIKTTIGRHIYTVSNSTLVWDDLRTFWGLFNFAKLSVRIPLSIFITYLHVKNISPDIVHLNSIGLIPSAIGAKLAGAKVVWHIREPLLQGHFGLRALLSRICINMFSDRIIAIGEYEANRLIKKPKLKVIYNFVDFRKFDRDIPAQSFRAEFNIQDNEKVVCMLGGVARVKGTLEFINALKFVRKEIASVKFVVVGDYPVIHHKSGVKNKIASLIFGVGGESYYNAILETIRQEKLRDSIIFTGNREDIPDILAASDLLVFPSIVPHSARPVIEASAMGKPVVASDLGGPRELVVDGVTGRLVPPGDPVKLAEGVIEILTDDLKAQKMGLAGYERARELFDGRVNAEKTFELYEEIANI